MNLTYDWSGRLLTSALTEQPSLILSFYSYGIMLRKQDGEQVSEYPVDPAQVASALAAKVTFDTGFLSGNTILYRHEGVKKTVVEYRPPEKTGIFLEGSETALRIPLPGLLLIRVPNEDQRPAYQVYAVKKRPASLDAPLFLCPLPNVFNSGSICWGSVPTVREEALRGVSLVEDWQRFFGSPFGDHAVSGKSKSHPGDIRPKLIELEQRRARTYPTRDLIPAKRTLAQVVASHA